ncbi:MAG: methionyl-tRNA formyltransferase, partial [Bacteroidota bacterium]
TMHNDKVIKLYRTHVVDVVVDGEAGTVRVQGSGFKVCSADKMIAIDELQQEGRKRMGVDEFLRGYRISSGEKFE